MANIPKLALRYSQLKITEEKNQGGSHHISRVAFEENNVTKTAFFKKLAPQKDYPELLAKMSVATSLLFRMMVGDGRGAEERLVFDDNGVLVGTLSIGLPGFKSFAEEEPRDTEELVASYFIELILARYILDDPDGHIGNWDKKSAIDFDMANGWFTRYMKGLRPLTTYTHDRIEFTSRDYERAPVVEDMRSYHAPMNDYPGDGTIKTLLPYQKELIEAFNILPKAFKNPKVFKELARHPVAQQQKVEMILRVLVSYQPGLIKKRLQDLFGDVPLAYSSLREELRDKYEEKFPKLCDSKTDKEPFVDFMMKIYQDIYDNLYRVAVFYKGCDDNGFFEPNRYFEDTPQKKLPLQSTHDFLYNKPSCFKTIKTWVHNENERFKLRNRDDAGYNDAELEQRYHQVWRDSFALVVKKMLDEAHGLTNNFLQQVSNSTQITMLKGRDETDSHVTEVWHLFGSFPDLSIENIKRSLKVEEKHPARKAMELLAKFTMQFYDTLKAYYNKDGKTITDEDNKKFVRALYTLADSYHEEIITNLGVTTSEGTRFGILCAQIKQLSEQMSLSRHLLSNDEQMKQIRTLILHSESKELPIDSKDVADKLNEELFAWVKNLKSHEFDEYVNTVIDLYYKTYFGTRDKVVRDYLKRSTEVPNDCRLAYILASGKNETGTLNSALVNYLVRKITGIDSTIPSITRAIRNDSFKNHLDRFTESVVSYAKSNDRFITLSHKKGRELFCKTFYGLVECMPFDEFRRIIETAIREYKSSKKPSLSFFGFGSGSKNDEIALDYLKRFTNPAKIVALIFQSMENKEKSTCAQLVFDGLMMRIKKTIQQKPEYKNNMGCRLLLELELNVDLQPDKLELLGYLIKESGQYTHLPDNVSESKKEVKKPDFAL